MIKLISRNAKGIPGPCLAAVMFLLVTTVACTGNRPPASTGTAYIRLDVLFGDQAFERANLLMVPADEDYRAEYFSRVRVVGTAGNAGSTSGLDRLSQAKHNAIKMLLENQGLCSVKNQSATVKNSSHSATIMSYEGAVKLPLTVSEQRYDPVTDTLTVMLTVDFAPLAFPDRWRTMKTKSAVQDYFQDFFSLFD